MRGEVDFATSLRSRVQALAGVPLAAFERVLARVEPKTAWLLGVLWVLKVVPGIPGLRQLRRVLVVESGPLLSVLVIFLMVVFLASVAEYFLERDVQPQTFGSVPAALWWAVVTLTTTGYGDVVPITPLGRIVAAMVMISGLGVFGLWTGILATGFAAETRRDNFLRTWETVSKVPFFAHLGPAAIADDIAYDNHDIDDGLRAGLLSIDQLCAVPLVARGWDAARRGFADLADDRLHGEVIRSQIGAMVNDLIAETTRRIAASGVTSVDDVRGVLDEVCAVADDCARTELLEVAR